ncbi:hypothetical protein TRFO_36664 [Tritrichomonas foetus]|uniref:Uncharacterized protein n=1 Tax=Tritrichomonas foetus TaxID=1144522 RepID=A0A1J4JFV7_9EUKA|nr:hypothetical protein TRFO_36664 [Tritrichomonas foetus]|eukprot:OHS97175.1 hypothetical protein TRFO_36664 [Tritrichomonas foetus]
MSRHSSSHSSVSTSRESTPTPQLSRSPTPNRKYSSQSTSSHLPTFLDYFPSSLSKLTKFAKNEILYYGFLVATFTLIVISSNCAPSFCIEEKLCLTNCQKCPQNARCDYFSFKCNPNFTRIGNNCISFDEYKTVTPETRILAARITKCIQENQTTTLDSLSQQIDESPLSIRAAILYTDYRIKGQEIVRVFNLPFSKFNFLASLSIVLSLCSITLFVIRNYSHY